MNSIFDFVRDSILDNLSLGDSYCSINYTASNIGENQVYLTVNHFNKEEGEYVKIYSKDYMISGGTFTKIQEYIEYVQMKGYKVYLVDDNSWV